MPRKKAYLFVLFSLTIQTLSVYAASEHIAILSLPGLAGWTEKSFSGHTLYTVEQVNNQYVLEAKSNHSASGFFKNVSVDLTKTPYLHWSWKIGNILTNVNERTRAGDDYPARIYVVISGGLFFWRTRALNYVWSNNQPINSHWPSAVTGRSMMIALQSGKQDLGKWMTEKRNILEDFKTYFGINATHIDAIAIMTDTDNSGQKAIGYYRNIYFSDK